jgi:eukaryotic translation initiation factor 2C
MHDDNKFTYILLENLTYRLCFLYARATRSVSVVPCVYYAHLCCARARFHVDDQGEVMDVKESLSRDMYFL